MGVQLPVPPSTGWVLARFLKEPSTSRIESWRVEPQSLRRPKIRGMARTTDTEQTHGLWQMMVKSSFFPDFVWRRRFLNHYTLDHPAKHYMNSELKHGHWANFVWINKGTDKHGKHIVIQPALSSKHDIVHLFSRLGSFLVAATGGLLA